MNMTPLIRIIGCVAVALLSSCVSYPRYEMAVARADRYKAQLDLKQDTLDQLLVECESIAYANQAIDQRNRLLHNELASTRTQYTQLEKADETLLKRYHATLAVSQSPVTETEADLQRMQLLVDERQRAALQQERWAEERMSYHPAPALRVDPPPSEASGVTSTEWGYLREAPGEYNGGIHAALVQRLRKAIVGFTPREATVTQQNDMVVVRLSEYLLFPARPDRVSEIGATALRQIATTIAQDPGYTAVIYAQSRKEGKHSEVLEINRLQCDVAARSLMAEGVPEHRVQIDEEGLSALRVGPEGALASSLNGEIVIAIFERSYIPGERRTR